MSEKTRYVWDSYVWDILSPIDLVWRYKYLRFFGQIFMVYGIKCKTYTNNHLSRYTLRLSGKKIEYLHQYGVV